ncbi:hypothetical protein [Coleofasciculus sp. F4-SAH-05]|uniref:hypothetical protein n=1 Tax=Coleofasciculus sp. F4-SAH-05 TaxID=3069525 RepID=UPI0032F25970
MSFRLHGYEQEDSLNNFVIFDWSFVLYHWSLMNYRVKTKVRIYVWTLKCLHILN